MSGEGSVVATYKPAVGTGMDGALFDDGFFNVGFPKSPAWCKRRSNNPSLKRPDYPVAPE